MTKSQKRVLNRLYHYFKEKYNIQSLLEIEVTETPSCWQFIKKCGGIETCTNPVHCILDISTPMNHTLYYDNPEARDEFERLNSSYIAWYVWIICRYQYGIETFNLELSRINCNENQLGPVLHGDS